MEDAVRVCAAIVPIFREAGIPVLRIGLNPSEELASAVVGGAYHPALGEMVLSRVWLEKAVSLIGARKPRERLVLGVSPGRVSAMTGHKRENLRLLSGRYAPAEVSIRPVPAAGSEEIIILECR